MVMTRGHHAGDGDAELLQNLLEACGQCIEVPESYVDIHTGLSGSGVAFVSIVLTHTLKGKPLAKASFSRCWNQALGPSDGPQATCALCCPSDHALLDHRDWLLYQTLGVGRIA